jgi:predicted signal transduction protein with EAL and GGDEF domain
MNVRSSAHGDLGLVTLSLGVAIFPEHASDPAALIKAADLALYKAKRDGRNRVVMAEAGTEPDPLVSEPLPTPGEELGPP